MSSAILEPVKVSFDKTEYDNASIYVSLLNEVIIKDSNEAEILKFGFDDVENGKHKNQTCSAFWNFKAPIFPRAIQVIYQGDQKDDWYQLNQNLRVKMISELDSSISRPKSIQITPNTNAPLSRTALGVGTSPISNRHLQKQIATARSNTVVSLPQVVSSKQTTPLYQTQQHQRQQHYEQSRNDQHRQENKQYDDPIDKLLESETENIPKPIKPVYHGLGGLPSNQKSNWLNSKPVQTPGYAGHAQTLNQNRISKHSQFENPTLYNRSIFPPQQKTNQSINNSNISNKFNEIRNQPSMQSPPQSRMTAGKSTAHPTQSLPLVSSYFQPSEYTGIKNMGNTCYINAVLQALMSLKSFVSDLSNPELTKLISQIDLKSFYKACLAIADQSLQRGRKFALDPSRVKTAIGRNARRFANNHQQDAHEFFGSCLNQLEEDLMPYLNEKRKQQQIEALKSKSSSNSKNTKSKSKKTGKLVISESDDESVDKQPAIETGPQIEDGIEFEDRSTLLCPSKRNFAGVIEYTLTCIDCNHQSSSVEPFRYLSVDVFESKDMLLMTAISAMIGSDPSLTQEQKDERETELKEHYGKTFTDPPSIENLIELYFIPETLERRCEHCTSKFATLSRKFVQLPRVLVIHLKRFQINFAKGEYEKVPWPVAIQKEINVKPWSYVGHKKKTRGPIPFTEDDPTLTMSRMKDRMMALPTEEEELKKMLEVERAEKKKRYEERREQQKRAQREAKANNTNINKKPESDSLDDLLMDIVDQEGDMKIDINFNAPAPKKYHEEESQYDCLKDASTPFSLIHPTLSDMNYTCDETDDDVLNDDLMQRLSKKPKTVENDLDSTHQISYVDSNPNSLTYDSNEYDITEFSNQKPRSGEETAMRRPGLRGGGGTNPPSSDDFSFPDQEQFENLRNTYMDTNSSRHTLTREQQEYANSVIKSASSTHPTVHQNDDYEEDVEEVDFTSGFFSQKDREMWAKVYKATEDDQADWPPIKDEEQTALPVPVPPKPAPPRSQPIKPSIPSNPITLDDDEEDEEMAKAIAESAKIAQQNNSIVNSQPLQTSEEFDIADYYFSDQDDDDTLPEFVKNEYDGDEIAPVARKAASSFRYKLQSIVHHLGTSASRGHYIAHVCQDNGSWKSYDDALVKPVTESEVLSKRQTAYILFYVHESISDTKSEKNK